MAKKSAASKGYRKTAPKKKTGYTKQEIQTIIIGFAVILLIFVAVLYVPRVVESFHLLKVKDDVIQGIEAEELVCNVGSNAKSDAKYRRLAKVHAADGYELSENDVNPSDNRMPVYIYTPVEEGGPVMRYYAQAGRGSAEALVDKYTRSVSVIGDVLEQGEVGSETINGKNVYTFSVKYRTSYSEDQENPDYDYEQSTVLYMDSNISDRCLVLNASNTGKSEDVYQDVEAMLDVLRNAAAKAEFE